MCGDGKEGKGEKEGVNKVEQTMKGKAAKELGAEKHNQLYLALFF